MSSPISDKDKLQYFRSMFDDDIRSYLTDEDRQEIAEEFYAKGIEQGEACGRAEVARALPTDNLSPDLVCKYTGLSLEEVQAL